MYGEGGRSRSKQLGKPKTGLGRLALESGVPVVPVAIHGSEHVRDLRFPKVTIQYGEALLRAGRPPEPGAGRAGVAEVFERIRDMHDALGDGGRRAAHAARAQERTGSHGLGHLTFAVELDLRTRAREDEGA